MARHGQRALEEGAQAVIGASGEDLGRRRERGAGEDVGAAGRLGARGSALAGLAPERRLPEEDLAPPQPPEDVGAQGVVATLAVIEGGERPLEVPGRVVEGEEVEGAKAGAEREVDGVGPAADGGALEGVVGQLGEVRVEVYPVNAPQGSEATGVELDPSRCVGAAVDDLADEDVREAHRSQRRHLRREDAGGDALGDRREDVLVGGARHDEQDGSLAFAPEDGGGLEDGARRRRDALEELAHGLLDRVGQDEAGRQRDRVAARRDELDEGIDEQRVALAGLEDGRAELRRRAIAERRREPAGNGVMVETGEGPRRPIPGHADEEGRDAGRAPRLHLAIRSDDEDGEAAKVARDLPEERQRGHVGGVQIVEDEDDGRLRGEVLEEREHRQSEARRSELRIVCVLARARRGQDGREADRAGIAGQEVGAGLGLRGRERDLRPRPARRRARDLPGPTPEHADASRLGARGELLGQARLADAGLAGEEKHTPAPTKRLLERGIELGELAPASMQAPDRRWLVECAARGHGVPSTCTVERVLWVARALTPPNPG
ncbi:MAG TPA: hypothetical protein VHT91_48235 [Kofleriaceae bacterium]|nr:hypothetical protein [Kofleriaceae bacterium]